MAERSRIRLEIRPIADAAEIFQNSAKYGTVGPLEEVNFHRCGRIGKVFRPPLRMAKRSCVRSKSHPIADEEIFFGKFENLSGVGESGRESCPTSDVTRVVRRPKLRELSDVRRKCQIGRDGEVGVRRCGRIDEAPRPPLRKSSQSGRIPEVPPLRTAE